MGRRRRLRPVTVVRRAAQAGRRSQVPSGDLVHHPGELDGVLPVAFAFSSRRPASPSARGGWGRAWIGRGFVVREVTALVFAVFGVAVVDIATLASRSLVVVVLGVAVHTATCRERRRRSAEGSVLHHSPAPHNRPHGPCAHGEAGLWLTGSRAIGQDPIRLVRIGESGRR